MGFATLEGRGSEKRLLLRLRNEAQLHEHGRNAGFLCDGQLTLVKRGLSQTEGAQAGSNRAGERLGVRAQPKDADARVTPI